VPREFGHRDNNFGTINYLQNSNFMYNIYKRTSPPISIQKNAEGLNRAEFLTVLSALVFYIIYSIKIVEAWLLLKSGFFIDMCLLLNIKFVEVGLYVTNHLKILNLIL